MPIVEGRLRVPDEVMEAVCGLEAPVIVNHVVPDADALGGIFAMATSCRDAGVDAKVALPDGSLSQRLAFLADWADVAVATPEDFELADGFITVDCARKRRCNVGPDLDGTDWRGDRPLINIDHHETNERFGDVNWVVETAGSSCELVYFLLRAIERPISPTTASLLYAGIICDTLGFSLDSTNAAALHAAMQLVGCGANVGELGERLFRTLRQSEFDLLRLIYANTHTRAGGAVGYSWASYEEIRGTGCNAADIDDQINIPRSLAGVRLAMLFTEGVREKTRINFRGNGDVSVVELADEFGGGGHRQAAGAVLDCGVDEAIKRVVPRAVEYLGMF